MGQNGLAMQELNGHQPERSPPQQVAARDGAEGARIRAERACDQVKRALRGLNEIASRVFASDDSEDLVETQREHISAYDRQLTIVQRALEAEPSPSLEVLRAKLDCLFALARWLGEDDARVASLSMNLARDTFELTKPAAAADGTPNSLFSTFLALLPRMFSAQKTG